MFTWVCQRCGKEVDIAEVECPHCAVDAGSTKLGSAHGADRKPAQEELRPKPPPERSERSPAEAPPQERLPSPSRVVSDLSSVPRPEPPPDAFALKPIHLVLFFVGVLAALAVAVYLARPDLFAVEGIELPKLPRAELAPLQEGPIEVAGIRSWRDIDANLKVRAVVVNHTAGPYPELRFRVTLRDPEAEEDAPDAAAFEVELEEPLQGRESREIETELLAPEGLTAIPDWNRIQVRVEAVESASLGSDRGPTAMPSEDSR